MLTPICVCVLTFIFKGTLLLTFQVEELVMPHLTILSQFRDEVRVLARTLKATDILSACDRLRDDILPGVGVRLEDLEGELPTQQIFGL